MNVLWGSSPATVLNLVKKIWIPILLIVVSLALLFGPTWKHYLQDAVNPYHINSDIRIFGPPMMRFTDPNLFKNSYNVDYYERISPVGYRAIYALAAYWVDPEIFSKVLGAVLFIVGVCAAGLASLRLGGWAGAWVSMALLLSVGPEFSGLPRDFSFPILAGAVAAMLSGRTTLFGVFILFGAAFYPPVGVIASIMLFLWLFLWPKSDRGEAEAWSFKRRIIFLLGTMLLFLALEGKIILDTRQYGPMLTADYCKNYPEIGPAGRFGDGSICQPPPPVLETLMGLSKHTLTDLRKGDPWFYGLRVFSKWKLASMGITRDSLFVGIVLVFILAGVGLHLIFDPAGRRLLIVLVAGGLGYYLSQPFAPQFYFPSRYLEKTIPIFLLIALPASAAGLATMFGSRCNMTVLRHPRTKSTFVLLVGCLCLLTLGGRGRSNVGFDKDLTSSAPLMKFLRTLPKDVMIAGWPKGLTESIPYLSRRPVLISNELHVPLHKNYTDEMRSRTYALIDAYFATTPSPLIRLHKDFGVTHMILEKGVLDCNKLRYFAPFVEYANQKRDAGRDQGFELLRQIPYAQVFSMEDDYLEDIIVLDLKRLIIK